jgi:hypothetical protein
MAQAVGQDGRAGGLGLLAAAGHGLQGGEWDWGGMGFVIGEAIERELDDGEKKWQIAVKNRIGRGSLSVRESPSDRLIACSSCIDSLSL